MWIFCGPPVCVRCFSVFWSMGVVAPALGLQFSRFSIIRIFIGSFQPTDTVTPRHPTTVVAQTAVTLLRLIVQFTPVLALYDPFGVDVQLNLDNTHLDTLGLVPRKYTG